MNCRQCQETIFEYVDGTLTQGQNQEIDSHLSHCTECAAILNGERNAMARMPFLLKPAVASFCMSQSLHARITESAVASMANRHHGFQALIFSWIRPMAAAAAIVLLVAGVSSRQWLSRPTSNLATNIQASISDRTPATNESCRLLPLACFSNNLDLCDGL